MRSWVVALAGMSFFVPQAAQAAQSAYSSLVTALNPKVYFQMDETSGTVATDSGSNGINGTYGTLAPTGKVSLGQASASAVLGTSVLNDALDTTPTTLTDAVGTGANSPSSIGTGNYSVEFWFKSISLDDRQDLMDLNGGTGSDLGIHIIGNGVTNGRIRVFHNADVIAAASGPIVTLNTWHHLVYTRNGTVGTLYLDGAAAATGTDSLTLTSTAPVLGIGNKGNPTTNRAFRGYMDEFAFYGSALSSTQVTAHYLAVVPEPSSIAVLGLGAFGLMLRRRAAK